jgi:hypothetical protein
LRESNLSGSADRVARVTVPMELFSMRFVKLIDSAGCNLILAYAT